MPIKNIIEHKNVLASQVREFIKEKGRPGRMIVKRDVVRRLGNLGEEDKGANRENKCKAL